MGVRASEPDYRTLFESLPGLYLVVLPDAPRYTVVAVSDACARAIHTRREEIVGRPVLEAFSWNPSEVASLDEVIRTRRAETRSVQRYDVRRTPELDGGFEERWWSPIHSPIFGPDGELTHIVIRLEPRMDVTEREPIVRGRELEEANRQLRNANAEISRLVDQAPDGIFVADLEGRYTGVNDAACRMLGYTREEVLGKTILDLILPEDAPRLARTRERLMTGGHELGAWTLRRKDGSHVPTEISANILPDGRWQAYVRDVSAQTRLAHELRAALADLNRAQSVAQIGSWRLDVQRNVLTWTDENYRIFGVPIGTSMNYDRFLACVYPDDRALVDGAWSAALRGEPYDIEHRLLVDGRVKWVREKAELEFDDKRAPVGGVGITQDITERKRLEAEQRRAQAYLRETQQRFALALEGAQLASWDWSVETGEVIFDERWAEMRGLELEALRPHVDTFLASVHPDDLPLMQRALSDHFAGRTDFYRAEFRVRTRSGWIWIADFGKVFARNELGKPIRMVGVELDITERRRLEEERKLAEAKASGIVSISADAIISITPDQRITLFNEGAERIFGYSRAEAIGAPLSMLIPERFHAVHVRHVESFAADGAVSRAMGERGAELVGRRKNGEEFPAAASISKLEIGSTKILTVALRDVTDERRVAREQGLLAEIGAAFAGTLDYDEVLETIARSTVRELADLCIVDLLDEGEVRPLTVVARDPSMGWLCEELRQIHATHPRPPFARDALTTRSPTLLEHVAPDMYSTLSADDAHVRVLHAIAPRSLMSVPLIARGSLLGVMTFFSSTPTRSYGPADLQFAEQIAHRAALAIDNARLYRAAERAVRARDEVLGIVAHDLRNPLSTVRMHASMLERGRLESDAPRKSGEAITRAANRMNRMIEDLLDVARIEAGSLRIERRTIPTGEVLSEAIEAQGPRAAAAGVRLRTKLPPDLPDVSADRERLLQVLENLIGNAMKFTSRGGEVTVTAMPRAGETVFSVADTGVGIAKSQLPHVFDRFWQARGTGRQGAGLGLAIVKGIVEQHGGRVWAESELGRGSTFSFSIPATRQSALPERVSATP